MVKKSRGDKIEFQKGPINLEEQMSYKFEGRPQKTFKDIADAELRRYGQKMDLHTPKK